jgi:tetratricopeptide (TPR) repeat protein
LKILKAILLLCALSLPAAAQTSFEQELALMYFNKGQYEKSLELYRNFYSEQPSRLYANKISQCLLALNKPEEARQFLRDHLKKSKDIPLYTYAELASINRGLGDEKALNKDLAAIQQLVKDNPTLATTASNLLAERGFYQAALDALEILEQSMPLADLSYQKAMLYAELGQLEQMFQLLLTWLERNPGGKPTIQNLFAQWITDNPENPANRVAKDILLERSANANQPVYLELLADIYRKEGQFKLALRQETALEKRGINRSDYIYTLGTTAAVMGDYTAAQQCFDWLSRPNADPYYQVLATVAASQMQREAIQRSGNNPEALKAWLIQAKKICYTSFRQPPTAPLLRDIARTEAFELNRTDSALFFLAMADQIPRLSNREKALNGLLMGDIQLYSGDRYESILTFARVEKQFASTEEADEARYRRGLNAYYTGDFEWARSIFKVLKTSTSKRIANDALKYDLLIADHINLDTSVKPLQIYARADLAVFQRRFKDAQAGLDSLERQFPGHTLQEQMDWLRIAMAEVTEPAETLKTLLVSFADRYPDGLYGDAALLKWGILEETQLKNPAEAQKAYETLITRYPASIYAEEARFRNRLLTRPPEAL